MTSLLDAHRIAKLLHTRSDYTGLAPAVAELFCHLEACPRCCDVVARMAHLGALCGVGLRLVQHAASVGQA